MVRSFISRCSREVSQPFVNPTPAQRAIIIIFLCNIPLLLAWQIHHFTCPGCQDRYAAFYCSYGEMLHAFTLFEPQRYPWHSVLTWLTSSFTHVEIWHFRSNAKWFVPILYGARWTVLGSRDIYLFTAISSLLCNAVAGYLNWARGVSVYGCGASGVIAGLWGAIMCSMSISDWPWVPRWVFRAWMVFEWTVLDKWQYKKMVGGASIAAACHFVPQITGYCYGLGRRFWRWYLAELRKVLEAGPLKPDKKKVQRLGGDLRQL